MRRLVVPFGVSVLAVAALVPAERAPTTEAPTPAGAMDVTVGKGRLSVNLRDAPLADALRLIGQEAHLKINLDGQFRTVITDTFTGLPLEAGIRRLTRGHSSSFAYGPRPHPGHAAPLIEIWIIESVAAGPVDPRARAARLAHVGSLARQRHDGAVAELGRILAQDSDPVVRTQAAVALGRSRDTRGTSALTAALGDQHSSVRIQAVHGLQRVEGERAAEALARVLVSDPDPSVRRVAAWTLALLRHAAAGSALGTAMLADGDASVRRAAGAAYRRWEQAVRAPPGR